MRTTTTAIRRCFSFLLLLVSGFALHAQPNPTTKTVSGKIQDETNVGISGVTVAVKGGTATTATKPDGSFSLTAPATATTLVISYTGYLPQDVAITGEDVGVVALRPDPKSLENVVVVGYGTRKRAEVTGATASISGENLRSVQTTNLTQALQGRLPGVVATPTTFRPGSGSSIRIRGNRSLSASNEPLYVVDGFPVSYTIDDINPADIETIDVLKDASATAIYGVRGANGVIQITTRKGRAGKVSLSYQGTQSVESILRKQPVFDGAGIADAWRQAFFADTAYTRTRGVRTSSNPLYYYPDALNDLSLFRTRFGNAEQWESLRNAYTWVTYDPANNIYIPQKRATTAEERTVLQNLSALYRAPMRTDSIDIYDPSKIKNYDWGNEVGLRNGHTTNHSISVTAGSDKIKGSFNAGYFKQTGIEYAQDYTRYSVGASVDFRPVKYLNFGTSISFNNSVTNTSTSSYGNALGMIPLTTAYDSAGNYKLFPNSDQQIINAVNDRLTVFDRTNVNRIFGNVYAEVTIFKGLKYRTMFGLDTRNSVRGTFNGAQSSIRLNSAANASQTTNTSASWVYDNILTYNTKIGSDHTINVTALQELQSLNHASSLTLSANNLIFESQKWYSLQNNTDATVTGSGSYTASQYLSYMGRIEYGFRSKYLLTVSARYDNSSVLAPTKSGSVFPAASVAWQIDKENFFANQRFLSYAKLRAGIGQVGNASIDPYQTGGPLQFTNYNWGNGVAAIGSAPRTFATPNLGWEKTTTTNLGLEFGLLRGRISGTIDLYKSNTKDLLQLRQIPATNGVTSVYFNLGKTSNKGIEISLNTQNMNKGAFRWSTDWLFTANKEKILDINGTGNNDLVNLWLLNQPLQVYWSYQKEGIFQYADTVKGGVLADKYWVRNGRLNSNFQPGKIKIADVNGDSTFSQADRVVLGAHTPDFIASIGNTFTWKNLDLNFLVYFRVGGLYRVARPGLVGRYQSNKVDYWTPTNPTNEYQQPTQTSDIPTFWEALTYRKATFAKFKNITLTYHLPKKLISKIYASNMALYFSAVNPILIHSASDYDPETVPYREFPGNTTSQTGVTSYSYRSYVLGVKLDL